MRRERKVATSEWSRAGRSWRVVGVGLLAGLMGLAAGALVRPSAAAQNQDFKILNLERRLDQLQNAVLNLDQRLNRIESRPAGGATAPAPSGTPAAPSTEALIIARMDLLQQQLTTQQKMLVELQKKIAAGPPEAPAQKTTPDDEGEEKEGEKKDVKKGPGKRPAKKTTPSR